MRSLIGTGEVDSWSWQDEFWDWTRWFFGTGEVNFGSLWDELWDITMCFFGTGESDIWVIKRWIMGHNNVTFWDRRSWYWDIRRWIMGQNKITYWDNRKWEDNNIFYKMKNDLTAGTWQDDIWCPIIIILFCTSDVLARSANGTRNGTKNQIPMQPKKAQRN